MQKLLILFIVILISSSLKAQEQKVEIVPLDVISKEWSNSNPAVTFSCSFKGIPILMESLELNNHYDLYAHLSKVPGVSISSNTNLSKAPTIRMRGDDNTIVIVDGIRYDTSILNTLNPSDIESIIVVPSATASNYLLNN